MLEYDRIDISEGIDINKQVHQKSVIFGIIAYTKKYLRSDWLRGVQYCPYLYSVFISCTLLNKKKKYNI